MSKGASIGEARNFLELNYGPITKSIADQAILVAERGLGFARVINEQLRSIGDEISGLEFSDWIRAEIVRSKEYGKLLGPLSGMSHDTYDFLTNPDRLFGEMPTTPELFGDNPESLRGSLMIIGEDAEGDPSFNMGVDLAGDEKWIDVIGATLDRAIRLAEYEPERFSGQTAVDVLKLAFTIVTGFKKF
jgi:hypothetical protein